MDSEPVSVWLVIIDQTYRTIDSVHTNELSARRRAMDCYGNVKRVDLNTEIDWSHSLKETAAPAD